MKRVWWWPFGCWHEWGRWEDHGYWEGWDFWNRRRGRVEVQDRECVHCGKRQVREIEL